MDSDTKRKVRSILKKRRLEKIASAMDIDGVPVVTSARAAKASKKAATKAPAAAAPTAADVTMVE